MLVDDILLLRGQTPDGVFVHGTGRWAWEVRVVLGEVPRCEYGIAQGDSVEDADRAEPEDGVVWMGCSWVNDISGFPIS